MKRHGFNKQNREGMQLMDIEGYLEALEIAKFYAGLRKQFDHLVIISKEDHVNEDIKHEAYELTKDGFEAYVEHFAKVFGGVN